MAANNIKVAVKVRPLLKREKDCKLSSQWIISDNYIRSKSTNTEPFKFDHIFDKNSSNGELFDAVAKPVVDAAVKGINGAVFTYGEKSSGKTYTMFGDKTNPGIITLAVTEIFKEIESMVDREFLLRVTYVKLHNENLYDLLHCQTKRRQKGHENPNRKKQLNVKICDIGNDDVNINCIKPILKNENDLVSILQTGNDNKNSVGINRNESSNKSHTIFQIIIESRNINKSPGEITVQTSTLNLVDLASSTQAIQSDMSERKSKEYSINNKSLYTLRQIIEDLSEGKDLSNINYHNSKLTKILKAPLGNNGLAAFICNINPTTTTETHSTLNFAMCTKNIKNYPKINEISVDNSMLGHLDKSISQLKKDLEVERSNKNKKRIAQLEKQINNEELKILHSHSKNSNIKPIKETRVVHCDDRVESTFPVTDITDLETPKQLSSNDILISHKVKQQVLELEAKTKQFESERLVTKVDLKNWEQVDEKIKQYKEGEGSEVKLVEEKGNEQETEIQAIRERCHQLEYENLSSQQTVTVFHAEESVIEMNEDTISRLGKDIKRLSAFEYEVEDEKKRKKQYITTPNKEVEEITYLLNEIVSLRETNQLTLEGKQFKMLSIAPSSNAICDVEDHRISFKENNELSIHLPKFVQKSFKLGIQQGTLCSKQLEDLSRLQKSNKMLKLMGESSGHKLTNKPKIFLPLCHKENDILKYHSKFCNADKIVRNFVSYLDNLEGRYKQLDIDIKDSNNILEVIANQFMCSNKRQLGLMSNSDSIHPNKYQIEFFKHILKELNYSVKDSNLNSSILLSDVNKNLSEKVEDLNDGLDQDSLILQLTAMKSNNTKLLNELCNSNLEIFTLTNKLTQLETEKFVLEQKLEQNKSCRICETNLNELKAALVQKLALENAVEIIKNSNIKLKNEVLLKKHECEFLRNKLCQCEKKNDSLEIRIQKNDILIRQAEEEYKSLRAAIELVHGELLTERKSEALSQKNIALQDEINIWQQKHSDVLSMYNKENEKCLLYKRKITSLQNAVKYQQDEVNAWQDKYADIVKKLNKITEQYNQFNENNIKLKNIIKDLEIKLEENLNDVNKSIYKEKYDEILQQCTEYQDEINKLESSIKKLNKNILKITKQKNTLQDENITLKYKMKIIEERHEDTSKKLYEETIKCLSHKNERLKFENFYKDEIERKDCSYKQLQFDLEEDKKSLEYKYNNLLIRHNRTLDDNKFEINRLKNRIKTLNTTQLNLTKKNENLTMILENIYDKIKQQITIETLPKNLGLDKNSNDMKLKKGIFDYDDNEIYAQHQEIIDHLIENHKNLKLKNEKLIAEIELTRKACQQERKIRRQTLYDKKRQSGAQVPVID